MAITSLSVQGFRTHDLRHVDFDTGTTLILGANGSGKTSLLEACYVLHMGTSFRGRDQAIIQHGGGASEFKAEFDDTELRRARLSVDTNGKLTKAFRIGEKRSARMASKDRLPVVLFEPDELRLLSSSPQRRRDFIDGIISRLSPTYQTVLSRFTRTLTQRNELLKQYERMNHDAWQSHLFAWDVKFAELSATIIKARRNFIEHSNQHLSRLYSEIADSTHEISAAYVSSVGESEQLDQRILGLLETRRQADALQGFTSVGPHRDDITLLLDGHPAADAASRGEMRSIMLAFKLLEVELQAHHSEKKPLILLDDVFSELDITREQKLIAALTDYQTIITATDLRDELKSTATIISL